MRIGIYARFSAKDQSREMQLRDLRTYCVALRFDLLSNCRLLGINRHGPSMS
jgi:DNA invertase Pin-like site-specific DNA recombinase